MGLDLTKIRNIGICAHIDAGKTTTTERILFYTGMVHKAGDVDDGNTTTDFDPEEAKRGITIYSAAVSAPWVLNSVEYTINVIDTPGHVDFTAEVERSLRVLDGAVAVFDAKEGVEAQSETVWRQASKYDVPRICFINKMDKVGADFHFSLNSIRKMLGANAIALQIPIGQASEFKGIVDLLTMEAVYFEFNSPKRNNTTVKPIPDELRAEAEEYRHQLIEAVVETDDEVMQRYLEDHSSVTTEDLYKCIRNATVRGIINPVLMGSAKMYVGVQRLLDAVCRFLPSPLDLKPVQAFDASQPDKVVPLPHDKNAQLSALVFKIVPSKFGDLSYTRIYSGTMSSGQRVYNSTRGKREIASRIYQMQGADQKALDVVEAGNICAIVGLKDSVTGDTLCEEDKPVLLESIKFSEPVISQAIEPKSGADKNKLGEVLGKYMRQDPTFKSWTDPETSQTMIAGMGELHLEIMVNKILRDDRIEVSVGRPKVSYRETITGSADAEGKHVKQSGGSGQFGVVNMRMEPFDPAEYQAMKELVEKNPKSKEAKDAAKKLEFLTVKDSIAVGFEIFGGAIDSKWFKPIEAGIREAAKSGVLAGYPMVNVKCVIYDGKQHDVDSKEVAFESAGRLAYQAAAKKARPILLEPIMKVQVTCPRDFQGNVIGDLNSRRAQIQDTLDRGTTTVINAEVPLAEMFGYSSVIRGMTQGRGAFSMEPLKYQQAPGNVQAELLEAGGRRN